MKKRVASFLALSAVASAFAGCTILPPTTEPPGSLWRAWKEDISELQKLTDKYIASVDQISEAKEKELMEV